MKNPLEKQCFCCKQTKPNSEFYYRSDKPHLLQSYCKRCVIDKNNVYTQKTIEVKLERDRNYHYKNRDKRVSYSKLYNATNKDRKASYLRNRYNSDTTFRLQTNLRNRVRMALKRNSKSASTQSLIGCSIDQLKSYLQSKFSDGMTWENYGLWQIDHIYPCSKFDLSKVEDQKVCFHYTNLQPLWMEQNRKKSNNVKEKEVCHR